MTTTGETFPHPSRGIRNDAFEGVSKLISRVAHHKLFSAPDARANAKLRTCAEALKGPAHNVKQRRRAWVAAKENK
jgi:hypothetical protein